VASDPQNPQPSTRIYVRLTCSQGTTNDLEKPADSFRAGFRCLLEPVDRHGPLWLSAARNPLQSVRPKADLLDHSSAARSQHASRTRQERPALQQARLQDDCLATIRFASGSAQLGCSVSFTASPPVAARAQSATGRQQISRLTRGGAHAHRPMPAKWQQPPDSGRPDHGQLFASRRPRTPPGGGHVTNPLPISAVDAHGASLCHAPAACDDAGLHPKPDALTRPSHDELGPRPRGS
jgi:hypothetical protein